MSRQVTSRPQVDSVLLRDEYDEFAPPDTVVHLSVVSGRLFLNICKYEETNTERQLTTKARCTLELSTFLEALEILERDASRDN